MLPVLAAEWQRFPTARQAIIEQLARHGIAVTVLNQIGLGRIVHEH